MTLRECYSAIGGDYDEVIGRLRTEERLQKFLVMFKNDSCYNDLIAAVGAGDALSAFRAAHTLKGVCLNLSLQLLGKRASAVTEALRGKSSIDSSVAQLMSELEMDYKTTFDAISALQ